MFEGSVPGVCSGARSISLRDVDGGVRRAPRWLFGGARLCGSGSAASLLGLMLVGACWAWCWWLVACWSLAGSVTATDCVPVATAALALWMNTLRVGFVSASRAGAKGPDGAGPSALPAPFATCREQRAVALLLKSAGRFVPPSRSQRCALPWLRGSQSPRPMCAYPVDVGARLPAVPSPRGVTRVV